MFPKETGNLPLSSRLSLEATETQAFSELKTPLLSMGQLCDDDCTVILQPETLQVIKDDAVILTGTRNHTDGLWDIPISSVPTPKTGVTPIQSANIVIRKDKTKMELAQYLHAACNSPTKSTLLTLENYGS